MITGAAYVQIMDSIFGECLLIFHGKHTSRRRGSLAFFFRFVSFQLQPAADLTHLICFHYSLFSQATLSCHASSGRPRQNMSIWSTTRSSKDASRTGELIRYGMTWHRAKGNHNFSVFLSFFFSRQGGMASFRHCWQQNHEMN